MATAGSGQRIAPAQGLASVPRLRQGQGPGQGPGQGSGTATGEGFDRTRRRLLSTSSSSLSSSSTQKSTDTDTTADISTTTASATTHSSPLSEEESTSTSTSSGGGVEWQAPKPYEAPPPRPNRIAQEVCVKHMGVVGGEWPTPQRGHWFPHPGDVQVYPALSLIVSHHIISHHHLTIDIECNLISHLIVHPSLYHSVSFFLFILVFWQHTESSPHPSSTMPSQPTRSSPQ